MTRNVLQRFNDHKIHAFLGLRHFTNKIHVGSGNRKDLISKSRNKNATAYESERVLFKHREKIEDEFIFDVGHQLFKKDSICNKINEKLKIIACFFRIFV